MDQNKLMSEALEALRGMLAAYAPEADRFPESALHSAVVAARRVLADADRNKKVSKVSAAAKWMIEDPDALPMTYEQALAVYLDFIRDDYTRTDRPITGGTPGEQAIAAQVRENMRAKFCEGLHTHKGAKYLAVRTGRKLQEDEPALGKKKGEIEGRSAHSFIDAEGNIWKPAGWKGPTKNFKRGNIFKPASYKKTVRWTGI